jgi:hypothetical protein
MERAFQDFMATQLPAAPAWFGSDQSLSHSSSSIYHMEHIDADHVQLTPQGDYMKFEKPSIVLAYASWASVFLEAWLLLLRWIPSDGLTLGFFVLFFFVAVMASAVHASKPKMKGEITDIRVKIGDFQLFSEQQGNLKIVKNGSIAVCVIEPKDLNKK